MGKTKEQLLNEKKVEIETSQLPVRLKIEKLNILKDILVSTTPMEAGFTDEQKWESVWNENEIELIKFKMLTIIRDL